MRFIPKLRKLVLATLFFLCVVGVSQAQVFSDVSEEHKHAEAIDFLSKEGIISGYKDGSFKPDQEVNRAEALKILLLANGVGTSETSEDVFSDVGRDEWFAPFVKSAKEKGIVNGYTDGSFKPAQTVNLVEALKMLLQSGEVDLVNYATDEKLFDDTVAKAWYNPYLFYASKFNLIDPNFQNQVFPATPLTRGSLTEIVYRFLNRADFVCPKFFENTKTYKKDYFQKLTLTHDFPNVFYENEVYLIAGQLGEGEEAEEVTAYYTDSYGQQKVFYGDTEEGSFEIPIAFTTPDVYSFSVLPGTEEKSYALNIEVLPRECGPAVIHASATPPRGIQTGVKDNRPLLRWENRENNLTKVVIRQGEKRFERLVSGGQSFLELNPKDFVGWELGEASLQIFGSRSENGFSFEPHTNWVLGGVMNLDLAQHYYSKWDGDKLYLAALPFFRESEIILNATAQTDLEPIAYLINPAGLVEEDIISEGSEEIPKGTTFNLTVPMKEVGTYILEINSTDGLAVLNTPFYKPSTLPLLPDFQDLREAQDPDRKISLNREKSIWLKLVNDFRAKYQLHAVSLDAELSEFAQTYAEEMATKNFFSHTDLDGKTPDERRKEFGLYLPVYENLAQDYATEYAHEGLLRSAIHRLNILNPDWSRVGLGVARDGDGKMYFVQEFSREILNTENLVSTREGLLELLNKNRTAAGLPELTIDLSLLEPAQDWSTKMLDENFFAFEKDEATLEASVKKISPYDSFSLLIASASSLSRLAESINDEPAYQNPDKGKIAIGLTQNSDGNYLATFVLR